MSKAETYLCGGFLDPQEVTDNITKFLPELRLIDSAACDRLEQARKETNYASFDEHIRSVFSLWSPIMPSLYSPSFAYELPTQIISSNILRNNIENTAQFALNELISPVIIFWSSEIAANLLPCASTFRSLIKHCSCLLMFPGADNYEIEEKWFFSIESSTLCLLLWGIEQDLNQLPEESPRIL
jgi:hypothetical protein